jgi:hypothetical protein
VFPRPKASNITSFGVARSFFPPELRTSQLVAYFQCPFSLAYIIANYGYCCSYCSCSTKVEKEEEVVAIQKHKKLASKRNPRNSKPGKIYHFQH